VLAAMALSVVVDNISGGFQGLVKRLVLAEGFKYCTCARLCGELLIWCGCLNTCCMYRIVDGRRVDADLLDAGS
jgi:hypothetical protein